MSSLTSVSGPWDRASFDKLCSSIRGKLQFMDYLVRAANADVQRLQAEDDPGTKIFLRQLVEMHTQSLAIETENMRLMGELCQSLEAATIGPSVSVPSEIHGGAV